MTLRLRTLASFVETNDIVCDVGCDHAYLPIYLIENDDFNIVYATEINKNAYDIALENIKKSGLEDKIKLFLTDGIQGLDNTEINTLVIAGMGARTILDIIKKTPNKNIKKVIIQANNDWKLLHKTMPKYGFYLHKEKIVLDKNEWYTIEVYMRNKKKLKRWQYYYGYKDLNSKKYYEMLYNDLIKINTQISFKNIRNKMEVLYKLMILKKYL